MFEQKIGWPGRVKNWRQQFSGEGLIAEVGARVADQIDQGYPVNRRIEQIAFLKSADAGRIDSAI